MSGIEGNLTGSPHQSKTYFIPCLLRDLAKPKTDVVVAVTGVVVVAVRSPHVAGVVVPVTTPFNAV